MATTSPVPPRTDPWFQPPDGYMNENPGTVLRIRTAPGSLLDTFVDTLAIYNILYRTTDSLYRPSWAVTTLFVPRQTTDGHALLSYTIPYNSCCIDAGPSFLLHRVSKDFWDSIRQNVSQAMRQGWYVALPDHWAEHAACGDGIVGGHATIDSIRSVLRAGFGMDPVKTRVALWGYSGGAVAAAWACELQPHYAPELKLAGAALGGLVSDFRCLYRATGTPFAGIIPQLFLGVTALRPESFDYLMSQLKPEYKDVFLATRNQDIAETFATFAGKDVFDFFHSGSEVYSHPLIADLFASRGVLGYHGIPTAPLFLYKSIKDELAPVEDTDLLVNRWGQVGVNVLYERNTEGSHMIEAEVSEPRAVAFLISVINGTYTHRGATVRDVSESLSEPSVE